MPTTLFRLCAAALALSLPATGAFAQALSPAERQQMLQNVTKADANDDGALTAGEFETFINLNASDGLGRAQRVKTSGRYKMVFNRLDTNGDGVLTRTEMRAMAEQNS